MPRSLKLLLIGVVAGSAVALVAATLLFGAVPLRSHCPQSGAVGRRRRSGNPARDGVLDRADTRRLRLAGTDATRHPTGSLVRTDPCGDLFLGGPAVGGWVAAIGTTELRELRGRGALVRNCLPTMQPPSLPAVCGRIGLRSLLAARPLAWSPFLSLRRRDGRRLRVLLCINELTHCRLCRGTIGRVRSVVVVRSATLDGFLNNLALVPLAWLMAVGLPS